MKDRGQEYRVSDVGGISTVPESEAIPVLTTLLRMLFTSSASLENAKSLITRYKEGTIPSMSPELWQAKKIVDSTLHPGKNILRLTMFPDTDSDCTSFVQTPACLCCCHSGCPPLSSPIWS
jgi:hypothetical protein